jgi:hypothetical protein
LEKSSTQNHSISLLSRVFLFAKKNNNKNKMYCIIVFFLFTFSVFNFADFDVSETNQHIRYDVKQFQSKTLSAPKVRSIPPARFIWELSGHGVIEDGHSSNVFISPNGDLSIVAPTKAYLLTCIVYNPITNQKFNKTYAVNIKGRLRL